jgi:mannose-6-phosphate isomerase-like protein (cupin superfamily)
LRRADAMIRAAVESTKEAAVPDEPVTRGYVVGPGEGVPGRGPEVKASGHSTGGSLTLIEVTIDGGPPRHTHTREDESLYLRTGTLQVECGADRFQAGPGSLVFLPRNLPHAFRSVGGPATALLIVTPGGLDEYFAELSAALAAHADPAQVRTIQQRYGIARS